MCSSTIWHGLQNIEVISASLQYLYNTIYHNPTHQKQVSVFLFFINDDDGDDDQDDHDKWYDEYIAILNRNGPIVFKIENQYIYIWLFKNCALFV